MSERTVELTEEEAHAVWKILREHAANLSHTRDRVLATELRALSMKFLAVETR